MDTDPPNQPGSALEMLDSRRVSRSIARQLSVGACLSFFWVAASGINGAAAATTLAFAAAALAFVVWQRVAPMRNVHRLIETGLVGGAVLVVTNAAVAGVLTSPFLLFFVWLVPWAFIVWPKRGASAYVVVLAAGAAWLLMLQVNQGPWEFLRDSLPMLLVALGGLAAVGLVVRMLVDNLLHQQRAAHRVARWQSLVADLARRALEETTADNVLPEEAARVLSIALEADCTAIWAGTGPLPPATSDLLVLPLEPHTDPARLLVINRPGNGFEPQEIAFARAVADILSVAADRVAAERARRDRAGHDELTGLVGREPFAERLADALAPGAGANVLVIDIDDFVLVNETLGPLAGDALLRGLAERLRCAAGAGVTLARLGGDEFAMLDRRGSDEAGAVALAQRVQGALRSPFDLVGVRHHVSASIGIASCDSGRDPREAIRDAHLAQRRAREQGRGRYQVFDTGLRQGLEHRRAVENELRRAIEENEFRLVYQPVIDLATGQIRGAEALIRWEHPTRGLIAPGEFIDVAEASDLIVPIGAWVVRQGIRQLKAWDESIPGLEGFRLSVNLSGRQLADKSFVPMLRAQLAKYRVDPSRLTCELTETALADESAEVEDAVSQIKALGVRLALDDFGTGYASLRYVRRFDFDTLKLDRSFIAGLGQDAGDTALVAAALSMADALSMAVVAEGVETPAQAARLRSMGCPQAQGFLFSRPVYPAALRRLMAARHGDAPSALPVSLRELTEPVTRHDDSGSDPGAGLAL